MCAEQRDLFKTRVAIGGVTEASWKDEHNQALDTFVADVTVKLLVVYVDTFAGLKTGFSMPPQVPTHTSLHNWVKWML